MNQSRRKFLKITGTSAVILAAGGAGLGGFAMTRTPHKALMPWEMAGGSGYSDPRMRSLSYAILAPNPHNRQPWVVDLSTPDEVTLYCDLDRLLPETDPFSRQITIGLGCFLEILSIAASYDGYGTQISVFPEGFDNNKLDHRPIAHIKFSKSKAITSDPLFKQILDRRSNKEPFDMSKPVSRDTLAQLASVARSNVKAFTNSEERFVVRMRDLTWRAHSIETLTPHTMQESIDLMRIGKDEINQNPDGIDLGGAFLEGLNRIGILTREALADNSSDAFATGMDIYRKVLTSSMAYLWMTTPTNDRLDQINTGRSYVRLNLKATELGLAFHPISQALQEYSEMAPLFDELHETVQAGGARVQMLVRLGYGETLAPSPRWPIDVKISNKTG